jgi:hypothetical protein
MLEAGRNLSHSSTLTLAAEGRPLALAVKMSILKRKLA